MTLTRALPLWLVDDGCRTRRYRREEHALQAVTLALWGTPRSGPQRRGRRMPASWTGQIKGDAAAKSAGAR